MKSAGAVKHKLSQVRFRHLKKRLEAELRKAPSNCRYNVQMPGDVPRLCAYGADSPETWEPTYCDEREDGGARARACTAFCPRRSKEQLKDEFSHELNQMSLPEVAARYPDMAALIWVLDDEDVANEPVHESEPVEQPPLAAPVAAEPPPPPPEPTPPPSAVLPTPVLDDAPDYRTFPPSASPDVPVDERPWWKKLLAGAL